MKNTLVVIFGEALLDIFKMGFVVGGAPFNVARHLAGFGQANHFISAIGLDNAGSIIKQEIERCQLFDLGVQTLESKPTGTVDVFETVNSSGHSFEIKKDVAYDYIESDAACKSIDAYMQAGNFNANHAGLLYNGTLALRNKESYEAFCSIDKKLKANNVTRYIDINWREGSPDPALALSQILSSDIVKASDEELSMLLGWMSLPSVKYKSLPQQGQLFPEIGQVLSNSAVKQLFVTYGELGSAVFDNKGECFAVCESKPCDLLIDTVGAGDAFSSVILLALTRGWPLHLSLQRANQFAGAICGVRGATPVDVIFYDQFIKEWELAA